VASTGEVPWRDGPSLVGAMAAAAAARHPGHAAWALWPLLLVVLAALAEEEPAAGGPEAECAPSGASHGTAVAVASADQKGAAGGLSAAFRIVSPFRVTTPEALRAEIIAAEEALALRAEVDGAPVVYDSPAVSISLRKVSPNALVEGGAELDAADGAKIKIPADPRVKGRHGGPVTVTVTSYHTGDKIKELPTVRYGANRQTRRVSGHGAGSRQKEDRVDFFMSRTSVSWRGTVNVKVPGLGAEVPAHDRVWQPYGEAANVRFPEEKDQVRVEVEAIVGMPKEEQSRALRKLAKRWHPDKNPEDEERATEVFEYLQELRESLFAAVG